MAKKGNEKRKSTTTRNILLVVFAFLGVVAVFVMMTPELDNITVPGTPTRTVLPPQRPGIVDIPAVSATVRDNNGDIRNISASVALDFDERQVDNYNADQLRVIVMDAVMQLDGDLFDSVYSMDLLSTHIHTHLVEFIDPSHLLGVHVTEIESGPHPIATEAPNNATPQGPTWNMN